MKKVLLSAIALTVFGLTNAQDSSSSELAKQTKQENKKDSDIKVAIKVGLNVSTIAGDAEDVTPSVSIHGGFVVELPISDKFSVQPELLYSIQGAKSSGIIDVDGTPFNVDENLKLSYINLPVMAKYYVTPGFSVLAGPQIGFLTNAKDKIKFDDGEGNSGSDSIDVKDSLKSVDFAFGFGLGYAFTKQVFSEIRYNVGLTNINDEGGGDMVNNALQISLGYHFN